MAEKEPLQPINGADQALVMKMVDLAIEGVCDHYRMLQFWRRLLAGGNDPEEIARGLAMALAPSRFIRNPGPGRNVAINLTVTGNADAEAVAASVKNALGLV